MADPKERVDEKTGNLGAGGGGSNDVTSGGGAGSGVPDEETAERLGDALTRGDVKEDRKRLFPEARTHRPDQPERPKEDSEQKDYEI